MPTFWDTHPQILGHFWKITQFCLFWYQTLPIVSQTCLPNYIILSLLSSENWLIFHFVPQTLWVDISESGHSKTLVFTFLKSAFKTLTFGICLGSQHLKVIWDFWPFLVVCQGHLELRALASQRYNSAVVPRWCMVQTTTQQGFLRSSHSLVRSRLLMPQRSSKLEKAAYAR